jgi:hypothetical protein
MKAKQTRVVRAASHFIMKAGASRKCAFFYYESGRVSHSQYIETHIIKERLDFVCRYKARSQLGQNSDGSRSAIFLPFISLFGGALQKSCGDELKEIVSSLILSPLTIFTPLDLDYQWLRICFI